MKKVLILTCLLAACVVACTKKTTNVIVMTEPKPAFIISGLVDITLINGSSYYGYNVPVYVQYNDSDQQLVTLSLSQLPAGITIDTTWVTTGYPSFTSGILLFDTTVAGATPGKYPMVLTAKTSTESKSYQFNIIVRASPPCTAGIIGKYYNCSSSCIGNYFIDSVYNDPVTTNKIWFNNFNNSGNKVYGLVSCASMTLQIPAQTVSGITYSGSGYVSTGHHVSLSINTSTSPCSLSMN